MYLLEAAQGVTIKGLTAYKFTSALTQGLHGPRKGLWQGLADCTIINGAS